MNSGRTGTHAKSVGKSSAVMAELSSNSTPGGLSYQVHSNFMNLATRSAQQVAIVYTVLLTDRYTAGEIDVD